MFHILIYLTETFDNNNTFTNYTISHVVRFTKSTYNCDFIYIGQTKKMFNIKFVEILDPGYFNLVKQTLDNDYQFLTKNMRIQHSVDKRIKVIFFEVL